MKKFVILTLVLSIVISCMVVNADEVRVVDGLSTSEMEELEQQKYNDTHVTTVVGLTTEELDQIEERKAAANMVSIVPGFSTEQMQLREYKSQVYEEYVNPEPYLGDLIVQFAWQWVGVTPYVHAGGSLWTGTDCSGFTHLIFAEFGIWLPTGSDAYQWNVGYHINYEDLRPGDIVVYANGGHVAIYAGDDNVIHCSSPENGTVCWNMWYREPTAFVRVIG